MPELSAALLSDLHRAGVADVRADELTRAAYSSDASLYRVPPVAVAFPRGVEEVLAALEVSKRHGIGLTARGAGTSVAGNAVGPGLVLDLSRHLNKVLHVDPSSRTAVVQPGLVQADLQRAVAPHGLRFGPDPSTSTRCTIGGMIGNNACGSRTLGYGRTVDNVTALAGVLGNGETFELDATPPGERSGATGSPTERRLRDLVASELALVRTEFGRFGRQASGYALEHLLPENGGSMVRTLVGSEGTLALVTEASVRLVRDPAHRVLVVLGFSDLAAAGDAAPGVLAHGPTACEGLDARLVAVLRERRGSAGIPDLPRGAGWLLCEIAGDERAEVEARAARLAGDTGLGALDGRVVIDTAEAMALWRIRADGAGLAGRSASGRPAYAGWEDAAVPPTRLGDYLRAFEELLAEHGLTCSPYGHFADGCLHVRLDLPMDRADAADAFGAFLRDAAEQVAGFGGSLSGEHGDGRARSELLPFMYRPETIDLFRRVKDVADPDRVLNPGVLVDPAAATAALRFPAGPVPAARPALALAWAEDGGDLSQAIHRCTGVGKCRAANTGTGEVMCPSYLATGEEKDSTRGRARVLQEMINGEVVQDGWRSAAVHDALDLCLSCKGCASDCPTGIDMAAYKSEVLHQSYRGRVRPRSHYTLGRLPQWLRLAGRAPRVANTMMSLGDRVGVFKKAAGVDPRRSLPRLCHQTFRAYAVEAGLGTYRPGRPDQVVLMVDTFTDHFAPEVGRSLLEVVRAAGWEPVLPEQPRGSGCCGLTWITTGQLTEARRILGATVATLAVPAADGVPILGIEPSCTAVLRHDAVELLGTDDARRVRDATVTLAELLARSSTWQRPDLRGTRVVAQPHCHHHATMGWSADAELLAECGAQVERLDGCCGLAGNFGVELGHYDVSVQVAEQALLPAVRGLDHDAVLLADGFSCRTQVEDLAGRRGRHLAELLAGAGFRWSHPLVARRPEEPRGTSGISKGRRAPSTLVE